MVRILLLIPILLILFGCDRKSAPQPSDSGDDQNPNLRIIPPSKLPPPVSDPALIAEGAARLNRIGGALHKYASEKGELPSGITGPADQIGLSWRVQLLPYLGEGELYNLFRLDEAWDSAHNKALVEKMPKVFEPAGKSFEPGHTHVQAIEGDSAAFRPNEGLTIVGTKAKRNASGSAVRGRKLTEIKDGLSNTLMVAEARYPLEWTKSQDLGFVPFGLSPARVPAVGGIYQGGFHGLMGDGRVFFFPSDLPEESVAKLITINRGETLDPAILRIIAPPKESVPVVPPPRDK